MARISNNIKELLKGKTEIDDYKATIKTEAFASNRKVKSEDKKIRIDIAASANIFVTALLIPLLVGVLVGVVVFGMKLSRR